MLFVNPARYYSDNVESNPTEVCIFLFVFNRKGEGAFSLSAHTANITRMDTVDSPFLFE